MGRAASTRELESHEPRDDLGATLRRHIHESPEPSTVERAAHDLLLALGADVGADGLRETPRRMAETYAELLRPVRFNLTTFPNEEGYDELVVVRDIPFHSLCMHHVLPFHGVAHVAYLPAEHILGLSKLARVVDRFARDLQLQERMTVQIANTLMEVLEPKAVGVVVKCRHMCMESRGIRTPGEETITSAMLGELQPNLALRTEFLALARD